MITELRVGTPRFRCTTNESSLRLSSWDLSRESGEPRKYESECGDEWDFLIPDVMIDVGFDTETK